MKKFDLFIAACKEAERWRWRSWICTIFNVSMLPDDHEPEQYDIDYRDDGVYYYDPNMRDWAIIEDAKPKEPLYQIRWAEDFPAGFFPNAPAGIRTTYGRAIYNWICIIYPFGDKIDFLNQQVTSKTAVPLFAPIVVDDDVVIKEGDRLIHTKHVEEHLSALSQTTALAPLITPTGTERTMIASEDVRKFIKEAIAAKGDKLTRQDLVEIQAKAVEMDKAYLREDGESLDFYVSGTTLKVRRFKQLYMFGAIDAFHNDGKFDLITESLDEGIPVAKLPAFFNDARQGSYDRGLDTAKGGYGVSNYQQITQNLRVPENSDCGTKIVQHLLLDEPGYKAYAVQAGFYKMVNGKPTAIVKEDIGKIIAMRRPILCKHEPPTYCSICAGTLLAASERQVASDTTNIQSDIMYGFMGAMHGNLAETATFDINLHLR